MRFDELDTQTLDQIGSPEAVAQARTLVQDHQVKHGYRMPDRLRGVVLDGQPYTVEAKIQDDQLTYQCSCPQAEEEEICPHVLALLRAWVEEPGKFLSQQELKDRLKKYSKKELLEIILDLADRTPEVRGVLKEEDQGLDDILESIDRVVEETSPEAQSVADAEGKLRRAQARADRLAQSGRLAEARSVYFYLLDSILSLEEKFKRADLFGADLQNELFEEYC
ncbi:MAG: SWIM zinc finger domain-containing protein, partial [Desulfobaccales bacterium]